jgi:uncharacterized protein YycO
MNLSFAIDDNLFNQANATATNMNKSVPELLREYLSQLASQANVQGDIDELYRLSQPGEGHSHGWRFKRQELYE